jgi:hypothetical protein
MMHALPSSCPPLPELPPLFWNRVTERMTYWQTYFAEPKPDNPPISEMREFCITSINRCLKRIRAGRKNAGRSLFEMSEFVACLSVIESRN